MMPNVFIYPRLPDQEQVNDLVSRLAWYMSPYLGAVGKIYVSTADASWLRNAALAPHMDPYIADLIPAVLKKIHVLSEPHLVQAIESGDRKKDALLVVDIRAEDTMSPGLKTAKAAYTANAGYYRVDAVRTRQEGSFYLWCGLNKFSDAKAMTKENKARLAEMAADLGHFSKAFVFGTGPSFSDYVEKHDFSGDLCIAANSIVKNKTAMEKLKPKIICAADPIYHAGCSSYAGAFRQSLVEALDQSGAWFLCPLRDAGVYRTFLPEHLLRRMICVPFEAKQPVPVDMTESFYVNPFPNVLTLMLLPLAATFADSIHVVGCDGRRLLDDSFFWSHDKKVQFNDQMEEIQAAHPGFFAIDYNDYYLDHCRDLEKVLVAIEAAGHRVITETPSLIPALKAREIRVPMTEAFTFVMLDPDAKDDWGHFLAYDKRLANAAKALGVDFYLLCRKELAEKFRPADCKALVPVFSVNSWTIGNKRPAERANILRFATELDAGLRRVEEAVPAGPICVFFYVGSLEAAEVAEFLLAEHPRVHAVINLFWSYAFDQTNQDYIDRWRPVARRLHGHPRVHLMHSTGQIAAEFRDDWGMDFPVLEHPSTTFSDQDAQKLAQGKITLTAAGADRRFRVVFPGGARAEKGFVLSVGTVDRLRGSANLDLVLRARVDQVSGPTLKKAYENLDKTGMEVLDGDLSDDEFIEMIETADIVVIPYHHEDFRRRTSGILVDAMLLGKPVVVLKDTWLADVVKVELTGVCAEPTVDGLVEAIAEITRDYNRFAADIERARIAYLEKNSWAALIRSVLQLVEREIHPGLRVSGGPAAAAPVAPAQAVPAGIVPQGEGSAIQLELDQLRQNFASLSSYAGELDKRLGGGLAAPVALAAPGGDLIDRLKASVGPSSARLLLTSVGSALLIKASETNQRLDEDKPLRDAIRAALAALPDDDGHKLQFLRVQQRFGKR